MSRRALEIVGNGDGSDVDLNRFQLLWNKIKKCEQRNAKAELKVDKLYSDYNSHLLPYEKSYGSSHYTYVKHLLSFVDAKGFKKDDRLSLLDYISEQLSDMDRAPSLYDSSLIEDLRKSLSNYYKAYFPQEMSDVVDSGYDEIENLLSTILGDDIELPEEDLKEALSSGDMSKITSLIEGIKRSYMESKAEDDEEWSDFEFNYYAREDDESSKVKEIFKGSQLNKIYKKIANIIHPDKELDPVKKELRHEQMQLLIEAKRNSDVFTLLKMYQEFVPDGEYVLDDDALIHVEHLLQMQIQKLNRAHREIFNDQGHKSYIWKLYSSTSRKRSLGKMDLHITEIQQHISIMDRRVKQLDSVKKIKKELLKSRVYYV